MSDYVSYSNLSQFPKVINKENNFNINPPEQAINIFDTQNISDYRRSTYPIPKNLTFTASPFALLRKGIPLKQGIPFKSVVQPNAPKDSSQVGSTTDKTTTPPSSSGKIIPSPVSIHPSTPPAPKSRPELPPASIPSSYLPSIPSANIPSQDDMQDGLLYSTEGIVEENSYVDPQIAAGTIYKGNVYNGYEEFNYGY